MYTPLRTDEENVSLDRIFFGGVNVFLQQQSAVFRHTPWFVDRCSIGQAVRLAVASRAGMEVAKLGPLTVSTLQGEQGRQRKEIEKLFPGLSGCTTGCHPSFQCIAVGRRRRLRETLQVPIVCSLAGEDLFLEQLTEPHYRQARELLRQRGQCG